MKKIFRANLFFLILVLLQLFGGYLILPIRKNLQIDQLLLLTQFLFLIVPVIIYIIITKQSFLKVLRIKKISFKSIGYIIIISILTIPIVIFLNLITNLFFHNNVNDLLAQMKSFPLWEMVLIVAMLPAFCEELTMRGVVLSEFKKMPLAKAAVLSGFLFAVLHMNPPQFLYAFALGVIFAYLVNITESIFASMIVHFIINGNSAVIAWVTMKLKVNTKSQDITSLPQNQIITSIIIYFLIAILCVYGVYSLIKKLKEVNNYNIDKVEVTDYNQADKGEGINSLVAYSPVIISVVLYIIFVFKIYLGQFLTYLLFGFVLIFIIYSLIKIKTADESQQM